MYNKPGEKSGYGITMRNTSAQLALHVRFAIALRATTRN
jgi:hypothetical protein